MFDRPYGNVELGVLAALGTAELALWIAIPVCEAALIPEPGEPPCAGACLFDLAVLATAMFAAVAKCKQDQDGQRKLQEMCRQDSTNWKRRWINCLAVPSVAARERRRGEQMASNNDVRDEDATGMPCSFLRRNSRRARFVASPLLALLGRRHALVRYRGCQRDLGSRGNRTRYDDRRGHCGSAYEAQCAVNFILVCQLKSLARRLRHCLADARRAGAEDGTA